MDFISRCPICKISFTTNPDFTNVTIKGTTLYRSTTCAEFVTSKYNSSDELTVMYCKKCNNHIGSTRNCKLM